MSLRNYRIPIPSKPPKNAIMDSVGRKWLKITPKEEDEKYFTEWQGDFWYVWFQGKNLSCPEEDEEIDFGDTFGSIQTVRRSYNTMRAVIEMEVYKDDKC